MYRRAHTCTHMYRPTHIHIHVHAHTHVQMCAHRYTHTHIHTCVHTYIYTHMHTYQHRHRFLHFRGLAQLEHEFQHRTVIPAGRAPLQLVMGTRQQGMRLTQTSQVCDCPKRLHSLQALQGLLPGGNAWDDPKAPCVAQDEEAVQGGGQTCPGHRAGQRGTGRSPGFLLSAGSMYVTPGCGAPTLQP